MTNPVNVIIADIKKLGFWGTVRYVATVGAGYVLSWGINTNWHF